MKYNDEIVGEQYEIRELVIINFIEWYASEEEDREPLKDTREKINVVNELEAIIENSKYYKDITGDLDNLKHRLIKEEE